MLAALQTLCSCSAYCVGGGIIQGVGWEWSYGGGGGGGDLEIRIVNLPLASIHCRPGDPGTLLEVDRAIMCHQPLDK